MKKAINLILYSIPIYILYLAEIKCGSLTAIYNLILRGQGYGYKSDFEFLVTSVIILIIIAFSCVFIGSHIDGVNDNLYSKIDSWFDRRNSKI